MPLSREEFAEIVSKIEMITRLGKTFGDMAVKTLLLPYVDNSYVPKPPTIAQVKAMIDKRLARLREQGVITHCDNTEEFAYEQLLKEINEAERDASFQQN